MLRDITIGQHFPGNSVLHRCDPRLKLVATIAYIVVLFVAPNPLGLALSIALLAALAAKAAATGREQLIFSPKDRERVGEQVVAAANEKLSQDGATEMLAGQLTLSEETRPMRGGFILSDGEVEVNCAFETLVRLQRSEVSGEVAKALFG